ncbi:FkbM family methyltransferase [Porphyrobacter sp. SLTP]|uniref:FkbM family methyltransferase n=1 Tax=Porphyrobacter sp. SLTP TaxID=2683266 RepID=UPI002570BA4F|nr:FkbM family methyltransferase [Porphyrobacter sp. SLTP]NBB23587.1 FkbM family methyltransferase [Porphyrobacter sp. SLTP]
MRSFLKAALAITPYKLLRHRHGNRFSSNEDALASLRRRGFVPLRVIDGGANIGDFSRFAMKLFPEAVVHAIEPQPGCYAALDTLRMEAGGRLTVHPVALCGPEQDGSTLAIASDAALTSTGAHVVLDGEPSTPTIEVPCVTLDRLFADVCSQGDRSLLKLDLQGFELHALRGASALLESFEVILTEVSFYAQAYEPSISDIVALLAAKGFELYDIATLYARPRDDRPRQGDFIFVRTGSSLASDKAWS